MTLRIAASIGVIALAACAHWQAPIDDSAAIAEIIALDDAWVAAEVNKDKAALTRILDEEFLATFNSGRTIDRATFIDIIMGADLKPYTVNHETIRIHGDTAVIIDTSEDGKTKFSWVAIKRGGAWRAISETFTTVEAPEEKKPE